MNRNTKSTLQTLIALKNLVGIGAAAGVLYLAVPWKLVSLVQTEWPAIPPGTFTDAMLTWGDNLADTMPTVIVLLMIVLLTLGPEAVQMLVGNPRSDSRPPRF